MGLSQISVLNVTSIFRTARETRLFAKALDLTLCFPPVASPQSNGMSEAFVKTLKRD